MGTYKVHYYGNWGGWTNIVSCPYGKFIYALGLRVEPTQGGGDDTAANGLMMSCEYANNTARTAHMIYPGHWGTWRGWSRVFNGYKLCGTNTRYENSCGNCDDTALN